MRLSTLLAILCLLLSGLSALTKDWFACVSLLAGAAVLLMGTIYQIGAEGYEARKQFKRRLNQ